MLILFTGGGTLGPVTPLLAVAEEIKNEECRMKNAECTVMWIGTRKGPERKLVEQVGIKFFWLFAPKWRRYFDVRNLFVPLALHLATKIAWFKLLKIRPNVIVTAGGYVGVPIVWAGWFLRIPTLLHNQDVRWSLANKLVAPFVKRITYALPGTVPVRWKNKAVWTGNPVRRLILDTKRLSLRKITEAQPQHIPTILIIGGGTGAQRLNEIVWEALPELTKSYQVIHLTGLKKLSFVPRSTKLSFDESHYNALEFVTSEIASLYAAADIVITRAGMGVLSELAALGKPMIIVPIPGSHQQDNARYFEKKHAAIVLDQRKLTGATLFKTVEKLFSELGTMQELSERARELSRPDAAKRVAQEVVGLAKK